jgi:polyhydroxybutyrate depolymerase
MEINMSVRKKHLAREVLLSSALPLVLTIAAHAQMGAGEFASKTLEHGGTVRKYKLYVPPAYDGSDKWPLVISFHGYSWDPMDQAELDGLSLVADTAHFLIA